MSVLQRLRDLSPVVQMVLAGVAALVIAALLVVGYLAVRPTYEILFRDLRPADAATIVAQLDKDKTPYRLADGGATILTPADRVDEVRLAIMGADLPLKGTVGFELFNKSDMGLTEFAQRINYQRALQGELARTIMTMAAIDTARVHLTLPEPSVFRADRKPAKASVALTPRLGHVLTAESVAGVRRLVAAAVPDLEAEAVVVVDATGAPIAESGRAPPDRTADKASSPGLAQTRAVEAYYTAALRRVLEPLYPGVQVTAIAPADQWGPGLDGEAERQAILSAWSPTNRNFRLQIEAAAPAGLSASQQEDVARLAADAVGWSAAQGDTLLFPDWRTLPAESGADQGEQPAEPAPAASSPAESESDGGTTVPRPRLDGLTVAAVSIAAALLLSTAFLLIWRRNRRRRLTPEAREAYVRRLNRLLDAELDHG